MRPRQVNVYQRVIAVIGLAVALLFVGDWLSALGTRPDTGWTGYAPLQSVSFPSEGGLHPWVRLVIWLILIVLWMIVSMAVLRSKTGDSNDATSP